MIIEVVALIISLVQIYLCVSNDINANKISNDKIIEDPNLFEITLKKGYTIISIEELEKLKRAENGLKDLLGTIENLNNKLKALSNDIRTISESQNR